MLTTNNMQNQEDSIMANLKAEEIIANVACDFGFSPLVLVTKTTWHDGPTHYDGGGVYSSGRSTYTESTVLNRIPSDEEVLAIAYALVQMDNSKSLDRLSVSCGLLLYIPGLKEIHEHIRSAAWKKGCQEEDKAKADIKAALDKQTRNSRQELISNWKSFFTAESIPAGKGMIQKAECGCTLWTDNRYKGFCATWTFCDTHRMGGDKSQDISVK